VLDLKTGLTRFVVRFRGFTWNPRFGPNPPSHGLSLAPDRPELWVLDAPNSTVHVFDVSGLPGRPPRRLEDIRLSKPLSGEESPCSRACRRIGSLQHSSDGRFVYVGDAGDVIDATTRKIVANLEALHNSRVLLEVAFVDGRLEFPRR
jgi:DNA-binding beta-propeller fold protein YncE